MTEEERERYEERLDAAAAEGPEAVGALIEELTALPASDERRDLIASAVQVRGVVAKGPEFPGVPQVEEFDA